MIRLVVTGNRGQVALSLVDRAVAHPSVEVVVLGRPQLDLEQPDRVRAALASVRPDIIVNAAAYTAVDRAESEEALAMIVNRDGAAAVAVAAQALGVPLVHLSTDYVFDGSKGTPYVESDTPNPLNAYGRSKLAGEIAVTAACPAALILRTAWVYSPFGNNFVKTMQRLGATRREVYIVNDQWGNPTSALDLAEVLLKIAPKLTRDPVSGLLHAAGATRTNWYELARAEFRILSAQGQPTPQVHAISTSNYPTAAQRPRDSRLDSSAFKYVFGETVSDNHSLQAVLERLINTKA